MEGQCRRGWFSDAWSLIKSPQTGLLVFTGAAGLVSSGTVSGALLGGAVGSLTLAISGTTVLNMVYDRDIDARMNRTRWRPLAAGRIAPGPAAGAGAALASAGIAWGFSLSALFGAVVLAGSFADLFLYTLWTKRRTPWSILWGGIAGGLPVLGGRVLGIGHIDVLGLLLAAAVVLWIPTHMLTFSLKYGADYRQAGVPVFPNVYGVRVTKAVIVASTLLSSAAVLGASALLVLPWAVLRFIVGLSLILVGLAVNAGMQQEPHHSLGLYKYASVYMLSAMGLMALGVWV